MAVQFFKLMRFVGRDVALFGGSTLTAFWQCQVIFLNQKSHIEGCVCTSLRRFESKFYRAPILLLIDHGANKICDENR